MDFVLRIDATEPAAFHSGGLHYAASTSISDKSGAKDWKLLSDCPARISGTVLASDRMLTVSISSSTVQEVAIGFASKGITQIQSVIDRYMVKYRLLYLRCGSDLCIGKAFIENVIKQHAGNGHFVRMEVKPSQRIQICCASHISKDEQKIVAVLPFLVEFKAISEDPGASSHTLFTIEITLRFALRELSILRGKTSLALRAQAISDFRLEFSHVKHPNVEFVENRAVLLDILHGMFSRAKSELKSELLGAVKGGGFQIHKVDNDAIRYKTATMAFGPRDDELSAYADLDLPGGYKLQKP